MFVGLLSPGLALVPGLLVPRGPGLEVFLPLLVVEHFAVGVVHLLGPLVLDPFVCLGIRNLAVAEFLQLRSQGRVVVGHYGIHIEHLPVFEVEKIGICLYLVLYDLRELLVSLASELLRVQGAGEGLSREHTQ